MSILRAILDHHVTIFTPGVPSSLTALVTRCGTGLSVWTQSVMRGRHPATASLVSTSLPHYLLPLLVSLGVQSLCLQVTPSACARLAGPGTRRGRVSSSAPGAGVTRVRYYRSPIHGLRLSLTDNIAYCRRLQDVTVSHMHNALLF